jgi:hypothetical protein
MGHRRILACSNATLNAFANTTNLVDQQYIGAVKGGAAGMVIKLLSTNIVGLEQTNSRPTEMRLAYDSTVAATATGGTATDSAEQGSSTAPGTLAIVGNGFTTKPQRSANYIDVHGLNGYGGGWKWQADDRDPPLLVGQAINVGEASYSAALITGSTTSMSGEIRYEIV